ncbi:protease IV [Trifolium pratense]|uniref:Protease IV n=1 Tax=Trifolium pratense TaxID=57577 RepID=A0A2K3MDI2_TRIPR|nr:protease IV [Trifolium pratense]
MLGVGGVVSNLEGDRMADFSHYEVGGDSLLAELLAIQMRLEFSRNIVCESDCLEAVKLFNARQDHTLCSRLDLM